MSRRALTLVIAAVAALVLGVLGTLLPVPYVALEPGPVTDTLGSAGAGKPLISVRGHATYPTTGHLYLTTVSVYGGPGQQPTLLEALRAWFDRSEAVVPQQVIYPPGQTSSQVEQENTREMEQSQQNAVTAALRELHVPVTVSVSVAAVEKGTPAAGTLRVGDVIVSVDGTAVTGADSLRQLIGKHKPGESVRLGVRRNGRPVEVSVGTVKASDGTGRAIIGVAVQSNPSYPFSVSIGLKDVGGPSAGMMFALGLIDRLTPGSLTAGRSIAGTGTIDDAGQVGPIGGIEQKVVGARRAGATVFLVPAQDCAGAKSAAPKGLRLVRVSTLQGAVTALEDIAAGRPVPAC